jgi:lysophospholipase L1-like esterase
VLSLLLFLVWGCQERAPASDGAVPLDRGTPQADKWRLDLTGPDDTWAPDAGYSPDAQVGLRDICFKNIGDPAKPFPEYDQFLPVYGTHCHGTNHQQIQGVQKVVFLGDSVTAGSPPTLPADFYRTKLTAMLEQKFGPLEVKNCSAWGARVDDLLLEPHKQILSCFPDPQEPKTTLVVMTVGGNDAAAWAKDGLDGTPISAIMQDVDQAVTLMRDAIEWFGNNPQRFPAGVYVIFASVYEYTDGTGNLSSCPTALLAGMSGQWPEGRQAYIRVNEQFVKIAVDTQTDVIFMLENFCGHGFAAANPAGECYRGPGTEIWFDLTCIHPNPKGHEQIAKMFMSVVNE